MIKKQKHILSLALAILLLSPVTVKLFDSQFHHHYHAHPVSDKGSSLQVHHEKCPIPGFEFSFFSTVQIATETPKNKPSETLLLSYRSLQISNSSKFSFLLRAPPSSSKIS